jgi:hypothetical protein
MIYYIVIDILWLSMFALAIAGLAVVHARAHTQKRDILSDPKLPDIFRIALAKSLQDDLFAQVC